MRRVTSVAWLIAAPVRVTMALLLLDRPLPLQAVPLRQRRVPRVRATLVARSAVVRLLGPSARLVTLDRVLLALLVGGPVRVVRGPGHLAEREPLLIRVDAITVVVVVRVPVRLVARWVARSPQKKPEPPSVVVPVAVPRPSSPVVVPVAVSVGAIG